MTKLNRTHIIVLNAALIFLGLGIVAYGAAVATNPIASGLLNAFGTTLAATGSITLLDRALAEKPTLLGPELVTLQRKELPRAVHNRKTTACKIDMIGITLTDFLAEVAKERGQDLVQNILTSSESRVRIMFMHPKSQFLHQRSYEDGDHTLNTLLERQTNSLKYCVQLYAQLMQQLEKEKRRDPNFEPRGSLTIKLLEACPYISYERYDKDIYWGLYTSDTPGNSCPVFLTTSKDEDLYEKLKAHFLKLLENGYESKAKARNNAVSDHNKLLTVDYKGPWLNERLVASLLDPKVYAELKKKYLKQ